MAEYIDRNYIGKAYIDLCKALSQKSKICPGADEPTVKNVFAIVMHAPAADVVEVRHGRWIVSEMNLGYCDIIQKEYIAKKYTCSECGYETGDQANKFACCPICMARMDKEDDNE